MQEQSAKTIVAFLLDRTGSMEAIKAETISGFNAYLDTLQREAGDLIEMTVLQFDSVSIDVICRDARLPDVPRLTPETYLPRAYTPLIDACFRTIKETEETIAGRRDKPRIIVVFQTDGAENASREHGLAELKALIERRKAESWQFAFLGADIDAYAMARRFGIDEEATIGYSGKQTRVVLHESAAVFSEFARGRSSRVRFAAERKRAAGDQAADAEPSRDDDTVET